MIDKKEKTTPYVWTATQVLCWYTAGYCYNGRDPTTHDVIINIYHRHRQVATFQNIRNLLLIRIGSRYYTTLKANGYIFILISFVK